MSLAETAVIQMLVDPEVRTIAGPHLKEWMFENDVNKIAFKVVNEKYGHSRPDAQTFAMEMFRYSEVSEDDASMMTRIIRAAPSYDDRGITRAIKQLEIFIKDKRVAKVIQQMSTHGTTDDLQTEMIASLAFALGNTKEFYNLNDPGVIAALKEETLPENGHIIKSYFDLINSASIYHGYKYGDVAMICGETGLGKTTAAVCEGAYALSQGFKVCHVFLGDMTEFDGFVSYMSHWSGQLVEKMIYDHEDYMTPEYSNRFQNLRIKAFPADTVTIYDLESKLMSLYKEFQFDLLIVDYDGNFKGVDDSMYGEGGAIYSGLERIAKGRCAVIVLSQVKVAYWGVEIGDKGAAAESSKKQHAISYMIYLGKNKEYSRAGSATLVKARRGRDNITHRIQFKNAYSRIVEISEDKYQELINSHKNGETSVGGFNLS